MKSTVLMTVSCLVLLAAISSWKGAHAESTSMEFQGVVTYHLLPAKVMQINRIVQDPQPGKSIIGEEAIMVEVEENPDVQANWTVVKVVYSRYPETKIITYELLGEQHQVTVENHAESLEIVGDLSPYLSR